MPLSLIRTRSISAPSLALMLLVLITSAAHGASIQEYALANPLKIYTVTAEQSGDGIPLVPGDQTNNFHIGDKVLCLSNKGIDDIRNIDQLTVDDNGRKLPLGQAPNLQIFLNHNALSTIPPDFARLQNVTFMYFNENRFTEVPSYIADMHGLLGMYFSRNNISTVPLPIFGMKQLKKLEFAENRIESLPEELGNLTNLYHLKFCGNRLRSLPAGMGNLKRLRVVDFSNNDLTEIPESVGEASILYTLRLFGNKRLRSLPTGRGFATMSACIDIRDTAIDPATLPPEIRRRTEAEDPRYPNGVKRSFRVKHAAKASSPTMSREPTAAREN